MEDPASVSKEIAATATGTLKQAAKEEKEDEQHSNENGSKQSEEEAAKDEKEDEQHNNGNGSKQSEEEDAKDEKEDEQHSNVNGGKQSEEEDPFDDEDKRTDEDIRKQLLRKKWRDIRARKKEWLAELVNERQQLQIQNTELKKEYKRLKLMHTQATALVTLQNHNNRILPSSSVVIGANSLPALVPSPLLLNVSLPEKKDANQLLEEAMLLRQVQANQLLNPALSNSPLLHQQYQQGLSNLAVLQQQALLTHQQTQAAAVAAVASAAGSSAYQQQICPGISNSYLLPQAHQSLLTPLTGALPPQIATSYPGAAAVAALPSLQSSP